jgi:PAS domain S-box-containing protein
MKTVLVAYEREQDLAAVETLLSTRGYRVLRARTGVEALDLARRENPGVVLSDVMLPKLDGFALCRRLKEDSALLRIPVLLHSFRVEGPKYEVFAAEVGAERFMPRGSKIEDLVNLVDELQPGSGTMRVPVLVPELLEKREQDRRRLVDLERQVGALETANERLRGAEREALEEADRRIQETRSDAERRIREAAERAATDAAGVAELKARIAELEAERQAFEHVQSRARSVVEESRAELARVNLLETRLTEAQAARTRAQAAADDAQRLLSAQPLPTWLCDMETLVLHAASDSAGALFGVAPEKLRNRTLRELLPGFEPPGGASGAVEAVMTRPDGGQVRLEVRRQTVSYAGRPCWLTVARDATGELEARRRHDQAASRAAIIEHAAAACCLVDADGRLTWANPAFRSLMCLSPAEVERASLTQFEQRTEVDATMRSAAISGDGLLRRETRWRRADGSTVEVEIAIAPVPELADARVVTVRDMSNRKRTLERSEREQRRVAGVLDLTQRAHSLTEDEIFDETLVLLQQLTGSEIATLFLAVADGAQFELAARRAAGAGGDTVTVPMRWRGVLPDGSALQECAASMRSVRREGEQSTGALRQAGLPATLRRQLLVPVVDGSRIIGVVLLGNKAESYDEDDQRQALNVSEGLWKVLRRRRSDAEVVSAMDHMERVMLGAIESLATLSEAQDGCKTGRARRVAELAGSIGAALGLPGHTVRGLRVMGQLIDVGMLQIPREILWRPGQLTPAEFELVKTHSERGFESLRRIEFPWPVAEVVRQHHERMDGSGYPRGLHGEDILLEARIVAVADAVEAMMSQRPQRAALTLTACIEELQAQAGRRYDAKVVKACAKLLREREEQGAAEQAGQRIA